MSGGRLHLPLLLAAAAVVLALAHSAQIRDRAEAALGRGMPPREAALARGFVLGEDEEVDARTTEDFRRAGLAHLLAVSGQNVALLALLAMPLLAALGMPLRTRLLWVLGLIAVYVPLAGAGPSIQRAGIMGGLSVLATLSGRRASRLYGLAFAAVVLLALEPGIAADVGWQLSFAAVLGILLLAAPLRRAILARIGRHGWRRALADGAAMTIAATLATAPLIVFHFEELSTTTLAANLLALPAVAPAMWLGMLAAAAGQVPGLPVEALSTRSTRRCSPTSPRSPPGAAARAGRACTSTSASAAWQPPTSSWRARQWASSASPASASSGAYAAAPGPMGRFPTHIRGLSARRRRVLALAAGLAALGFALAPLVSGGGAAGPPPGLRVSVLDVGQGDAILLQPRGAPAVLVDGGPPGDGIAAELRDAGVERLGAAIVTHDQADHAGGVRDLLGTMPIERVLLRRAAALDPRSGPRRRNRHRTPGARQRAARRATAARRALAATRAARRPAPRRRPEPAGDRRAGPLARLLDPAHRRRRGGDDAARPRPGRRAQGRPPRQRRRRPRRRCSIARRPRLAAISVGAGNPFGHPTPGTLATLAAHDVPVLRTDLDGTVTIDVSRAGFRVEDGGH